MTHELALAILDTSNRIPDVVARRCRSLTLSWSRRDYSAPVYEGERPEALMRRALDAGHRLLFMQTLGHVIARAPGPKGAGVGTFFEELISQAADDLGDTCLALGIPVEGTSRLHDRCVLFDLHAWDRKGRPTPKWDAEAGHLSFDDSSAAVAGLGPDALAWSVYLHPEREDHRTALLELTQHGLERLPAVRQRVRLAPAAEAFLTRLATIVLRSPEGVFPWNFEGYDDVTGEPVTSARPLDSLYCVAAGFKPNAILRHYGFDQNTRVVLVDYSRNALDIRRWLIESWDGRDFARALPHMLERFPPESTFYHLPGVAEGAPDRDEMERLWAQELEDWGGADAFAEHWQRYRELDHVYVHANLLTQPEVLLAQVRNQRASVMWWSNVFYSAYCLWNFDLDEREERYLDWLRCLDERCPRLRVYGYDESNRCLDGAEPGSYLKARGRY